MKATIHSLDYSPRKELNLIIREDGKWRLLLIDPMTEIVLDAHGDANTADHQLDYINESGSISKEEFKKLLSDRGLPNYFDQLHHMKV